MPPEMIPCPKCGEPNSTKKQVCHHCLAALGTPPPGAKTAVRAVPAPPVKRTTQPSTTSSPTAPQHGFTWMDYVFGVSLRERAQFYRQMNGLLNAGIPIGLSLQHSAENCAYAMRSRIRDMADHTQAGGLMSDVMVRYPALFPDWEISVLMASEKAGTLPQVMHDIADALEREWDLRSRTKVAAFPVIATFVVFVLVAMLVFSIGNYTTTTELGGSVNFGGLFGSIFVRMALLVVLVIAIIVGWRMLGRTRMGGILISRLMPRVPLIGPILQAMKRIRFVTVLSTLWHAGIAPLQAVEIAARTTGDRRLIDQLEEATGRFSQGITLSALITATDFLPQHALYLLQTGEVSGNIAGALEKIAEYHTIEVDAQVKTMPMKVQLLLYAIVVPLVLWLLLKFYGGYFSNLLNMTQE